ncbi:MAG: DUF3667 domain-containing protein [Flammeovirgaceae bacterium]
MESNQCQNCGNTFSGRYCNHCGQKLNSGRIQFNHVIGDVVATVFSLESPIVRTIRGLTIHPGKLAKAYIAGKRKSYNRPAQYFLVMIALHFIVLKLLNIDYLDLQQRAFGTSIQNQNSNAVFSFIVKNLNYFSFIMAIWLSLFSKLFFLKTRYSLIELFSFFLFVLGQGFLFHTLFLVIADQWIIWYHVAHTFQLLYILFAIYTFFEAKWWIRFPLSLFALVFGSLLYFFSVGFLASVILFRL